MEFLWKSAVVLSLFFLVYKALLERETFYGSIRTYLLLGPMMALVMPLITVKKYVTVEAAQAVFVPQPSNAVLDQTHTGITTEQVLLMIYAAGALFFLCRFLIQLGNLTLFLWRNPKMRKGRYIMMPTTKKMSPFSFFNYIVYPHERFDAKELEQIMAHEKAHADGLHSIDVMLGQLLCITQWFNPFAWLYAKEINKNLEFIADASAESVTENKENYAYLLLKTSVNEYALALALTSNFYNSLIKKRIQMLQKNKSSKAMYLKFTLILPLMLAFLFTFNTEVIAQAKKEQKVIVEKEIRVEVIDKNAQKSDLDAMKASWAKEGVTLNYKKLKYNAQKEIIGIELNVSSDKGSRANLSLSGTEPIEPISIKYDKNSGSLSLGNVQSMAWDMEIHEGKGMHKKVFVTSGGDKEVVVIKGDSAGTWHAKGENVFMIKGDKSSGVNWTSEDVITLDVRGDEGENVWVTKSGDSTMIKKRIKVIKIGEGDQDEEVIIEEINEGDGEMKVIVKTIDKEAEGDHEMMFIGDGDASLVIIDGKESTHEELKKLSPDKIETINVWKGDKAVEKYGEKAKDGVIEVKTKP